MKQLYAAVFIDIPKVLRPESNHNIRSFVEYS